MNLITRDELLQELVRGDELKLVMALPAHAYSAKRIPGSLHFETADETLAALDPADEIVIYCSNVYCAASIYAYRLLERKGYERIRRYAGGVSDWEEAGYPLEMGPAESSAPLGSSERPARAASRSHASVRSRCLGYA